MIKSYKVRLIPTEEQEQKMWDSVNAARFVWNWGLGYQIERFKQGEERLSGYDMKKLLTRLKQEEEYQWLNGVSNKTLSMPLLDLDNAYVRFFTMQDKGEKYSKAKTARAKRLNRKLTFYDMLGHPKFKKKAKAKPSFYVNYEQLYFLEDSAVLEKIGKVKYQTDHNLPTVSKKGQNITKFTNPRVCYENGKWILTFGMECDSQAQVLNGYLPAMPPPVRPAGAGRQVRQAGSMGIDLGVKDLAVISYDGNSKKFKNINKTKAVRRIKKRLRQKQRNVSRKYRVNGSYDKTERILKEEAEVKKLHSKLANIRHNYTHHVTREIINLNPSSIGIEDLNVSGMMKNRHLSEAIQEQTLHEFRRQLEYKAKWAGIDVIKAGRFYPSSKKCSGCGHIKRDLKLKDRTYKCSECGLSIDRDLNAARNLERLAI
jgi:putative transposase